MNNIVNNETLAVKADGLDTVTLANASIERANIILKLIAKHVRPSELRLFQENLHFERGACEKILLWAGASIKKTRIEKIEILDEKNERYYIFECWGSVFLGDRELEVVGNCSTRSEFFGVRNGMFKPLSEIDIPSVRISAYTNMLNHACIRSLGLKSLTLDDLKFAGMDTSRIGQVSFVRGGRGGSPITPEEKDRQTKVGNWLLEMSGGDKANASIALIKITTFVGKDGTSVAGVESCAKLTGKRLEITYSKVKEEYHGYCKKNQIPFEFEEKKSE